MTVPQGVVTVGLVLDLLDPLGLQDGGGRVDVVEQRGGAGEPLVAHEVLGVEAAVGFAEGDVALPGDLA